MKFFTILCSALLICSFSGCGNKTKKKTVVLPSTTNVDQDNDGSGGGEPVDEEPTTPFDIAVRLKLGELTSGLIELDGTFDWYSVELEEGHDYMVQLFHTNGLPYSLALYNYDGELLASTNKRVLKFKPTEYGIYYLSVGSSAGVYKVLVKPLGSDD